MKFLNNLNELNIKELSGEVKLIDSSDENSSDESNYE
jgi:hypothetical protein